MAKYNKIFLDANILLELLLPGRAKTKECEQFLQSYKGQFVISSLSIHIAYYYCKKQGYSISQVDSFISDFEIASVGRDEYLLAIKLVKGDDIEDALQVATSISNDCNDFLTIDKQLAKTYSQNTNIILL
jgi:predicted nucleic acid-binding protein